jgi:hypothetical protein
VSASVYGPKEDIYGASASLFPETRLQRSTRRRTMPSASSRRSARSPSN